MSYGASTGGGGQLCVGSGSERTGVVAGVWLARAGKWARREHVACESGEVGWLGEAKGAQWQALRDLEGG